MKKVIILGLFALLFGIMGCSSSSDTQSDLTLQDFIKAYQDHGVEVDPEKKPVYQMIGAKDGVIFEMNEKKVAIYQFQSKSKIKDAKSKNETISEWPVNGIFLLEAYTSEAEEIFQNVK